MSESEPDIIYIRKSDKASFTRLLEKDSPFYGKKKQQLFLMAMATGFNEGKKIEIGVGERDTGGFFRNEYLSPRERVLIKAIAVADSGSLEILSKKKEIYKIAEGYAAGGILSLKREVLGSEITDLSRKMEIILLEAVNKYKQKNGDTDE